jgi:hypothetical protein
MSALPVSLFDNSGMSERVIRTRMKAGEPPATAEEYLLRVRLEAEDLGNVIGQQISPANKTPATTSTTTTPTATTIIPDFQSCPPALMPSPVWQRHCASCFSECRQYLVRVEALHKSNVSYKSPPVPPMNDGYAWEKLCFGTNSFAVATGKHDPAPVPFDHTLPPLLRVVVGLNTVDVSKLLNKHVGWLCGGGRSNGTCTGSSGSSGSSGNRLRTEQSGNSGNRKAGRPLTSVRAAWLYALLVRIDKPLSRHDSSTLRSLGRYLSRIRATTIVSSSDARLPRINLILTLIECGFGQGRIRVSVSK